MVEGPKPNDQDTEATGCTGSPMACSIAFHPVANLFPMMSAKTFRELCEDIGTNGQLTPIWLHGGQIIDGRNRYRACLELGIEPHFKDWDEQGTLVDFVISLNLKRRHLTPTQRAMVAFRMLPMLESETKERQIRKPAGSVPEILPEQKLDSRDQAAAIVGVSGKYVSDVKRIAREAPEKLTALEAGTLTLQGAKRQLWREANEPLRQDGKAIHLAAKVITQLSRIEADTAQTLVALDRVKAYVEKRILQLSTVEKAEPTSHTEEEVSW